MQILLEDPPITPELYNDMFCLYMSSASLDYVCQVFYGHHNLDVDVNQIREEFAGEGEW